MCPLAHTSNAVPVQGIRTLQSCYAAGAVHICACNDTATVRRSSSFEGTNSLLAILPKPSNRHIFLHRLTLPALRAGVVAIYVIADGPASTASLMAKESLLVAPLDA